jgi:hypothetical protein
VSYRKNVVLTLKVSSENFLAEHVAQLISPKAASQKATKWRSVVAFVSIHWMEEKKALLLMI